jgi:hypothetical protein
MNRERARLQGWHIIGYDLQGKDQGGLMSRDYDDDLKAVVWFVAGVGVGAAVALLFAPQSGKETRKLIARTAEKSREYVGERAEHLRDKGRDLYERSRDLAREVGEEAADLVDRGRKIVRG